MSAEVLVDNQLASLYSSLSFGEDLRPVLDCPRDATCPWVRVRRQHFERDATDDNLGFDVNGSELASGFTTVTARGWRLGAALSYENLNLDSNSPASSDGDLVYLGLSLGRLVGPAEYSASIAGGYGRYDIKRRLQVGGDATLDARQEVSSVEGRVGAAYH